MKKNDIFMPVKICVLQAWPSFDDKNATKFYAKNGQPYFPMTVANVSFGTKTVEFTPDLYCELISISSPEEARAFTEKHPTLRFAFSGQAHVSLQDFETMASYYEIMTDAIARYNDIKGFVAQQIKECAGCSPELLEMYKKHYPRLRGMKTSWFTFCDMEAALYQECDVVDEICELVMEQDPTTGATYEELRDSFFEGNEELRSKHQAAVTVQVKQRIQEIMTEDLARYFEEILQSAAASYSASEGAFVYNCKDLMTAMYMMTYLAAFNDNEYRECAHEKCHKWYLVDKKHPQSRCPEHMAARQRKRQNYKATHPIYSQ